MSVFIKITDRNWIIERLASELASRLRYVEYDTRLPASVVDALYSMTYSAYSADDHAKHKLAFFSHLEDDANARDRFFDVARHVDHRICMADRYARLLEDEGCGQSTVIIPGVDLDQYQVKLRLGVVGRTYHTGRKGEALVSELIDMPDIEWVFTGSGWPHEAQFVAEDDMPAFYRSLDFLLVPSRYEGGPMPMIEALACGVQVIAPDVGFVDRFPHIAYATNDAADLRRVLHELLEKKKVLRRSVEDTTWDQWAEQHDRLFQEMDCTSGNSMLNSEKPSRRAELVLHGTERTTLGGPSLRVPRTAQELSSIGWNAQRVYQGEVTQENEKYELPDIIHVFNAWSPDSALKALEEGRSKGSRLIFSPIYLGLAELQGYQQLLPKAAATCDTVDDLRARLVSLRDNGYLGALALQKDREPVAGYHAKLQHMLSFVDHVICLSEKERSQLKSLGLEEKRSSLVYNPVDFEHFRFDKHSTAFSDAYGISDFILCVGRIEPRKNQLLLAVAAKEMGVPLVLIGHEGDPTYFKQVIAWGGDSLLHLDRLDPADPVFLAAFSQSACFALPSFAEGAPMAALEAAACGCNLVLSDRSGEQEYFGDLAQYCDPSDLDSIIDALQIVLNDSGSKRSLEATDESASKLEDSFSWRAHASATALAYEQALASAPCVKNRSAIHTPVKKTVELVPADKCAASEAKTLWIDLTTSLHNKSSRISRINRVEWEIAQELNNLPRQTRPLCWVGTRQGVAELSEFPVNSTIDRLRCDLRNIPDQFGQTVEPERYDHLIVAGSAWMQNANYTDAIVRFVQQNGLVLSLVVYDLVPYLFPQWYAADYSPVFERNLAKLCGAATRLLCISNSTCHDLARFLEVHSDKRIQLLPMGNSFLCDQVSTASEIPDYTLESTRGELQRVSPAEPASESIVNSLRKQPAYSISRPTLKSEVDRSLVPKQPFILAVGAIHPRKNYDLLYNVWIESARSSEGPLPDFVIVGGFGWHSDWLKYAIANTPALKGHWHVLSGVDDDQLIELYRECLFTVYPSLYEGWGLPVAESLASGKVCLCSNRSSLPEVAPAKLLVSLDPYDTHEWIARIRSMTRNRTYRQQLEQRIAEEYRGNSWQACVQELLTLLPRVARINNWRHMFYQEFVEFTQRSAASLLGDGWGGLEADGVFTIDNAANLHWISGDCLASRRGVWIQYSVYLPRSGMEHVIGVRQDGLELDEWRVTAPGRHMRFLPIDPSKGNLELAIKNPLQPHLVNGEGDLRRLGLKLHALWFGESRQEAKHWFGISDSAYADVFHQLPPSIRPLEAKLIDSAWGYTAFSRQALEVGIAPDTSHLHMIATCRAVATVEEPLEVTLMANEVPVARYSISHDGLKRLRFQVPAEVQAKCQPLRVRASLARQASPASIGLGASQLPIGLGLIALDIETDRQQSKPSQFLVHTFQQRSNGKVDLFGCLLRGWNRVEGRAVWSNSSVSTLALPARGPSDVYLLQSNVSWISSRFPIRQLRLGNERLKWRLMETGEFSGRLSVLIHRSTELLTFFSQKPQSPWSMGVSKDERLLGFQMQNFSFQRVPASGLNITQDGWHAAEPEGNWTSEKSSRLLWCDHQPVERGVTRNGLIKLSHISPHSQEVRISVNDGDEIATLVPPEELVEIRFPLVSDEHLHGMSGLYSIKISVDELHTPKSLGLSADTRQLGVFMCSLKSVSGSDSSHTEKQSNVLPIVA